MPLAWDVGVGGGDCVGGREAGCCVSKFKTRRVASGRWASFGIARSSVPVIDIDHQNNSIVDLFYFIVFMTYADQIIKCEGVQ